MLKSQPKSRNRIAWLVYTIYIPTYTITYPLLTQLYHICIIYTEGRAAAAGAARGGQRLSQKEEGTLWSMVN